MSVVGGAGGHGRCGGAGGQAADHDNRGAAGTAPLTGPAGPSTWPARLLSYEDWMGSRFHPVSAR